MDSITILGAGRVGRTLAAALAEHGRQVVLGVRDQGRAQAEWSGSSVSFTDVRTAISRSEIIINATPGDTALERFGGLSNELAGTVFIDVSNATVRGDDGMPGSLLYPGSSLGERLQSALPETRVVKTLNTMLFSAMAAPRELGSAPTVFLSGDDDGAKTIAKQLLAELGWDERWMLDIGGIETARGTEALALLVPSLLRTLGFAPFALSIAR